MNRAFKSKIPDVCVRARTRARLCVFIDPFEKTCFEKASSFK